MPGPKVGSGELFEYGGKRLTVLGWAAETGLSKNTLYSRFNAVREGAWTMEEALTTPVNARTRGGVRASGAPRRMKHSVRRSKEDGQLEVTMPSEMRRLAAADERIEAEIRKLRALVIVPAGRASR